MDETKEAPRSSVRRQSRLRRSMHCMERDMGSIQEQGDRGRIDSGLSAAPTICIVSGKMEAEGKCHNCNRYLGRLLRSSRESWSDGTVDRGT